MGRCIRSVAPQEDHCFDAFKLPNHFQPDLWMDFTHAEVFDKVLKDVRHIQCPLVMGTTGLSNAQYEALKELSQTQVIVYDSTFL